MIFIPNVAGCAATDDFALMLAFFNLQTQAFLEF